MKKNHTNLILIISIIILLLCTGSFIYLLSIIKNKNLHTSVVLSTLEEKISEKENINDLEKKILELGDVKKRINDYLIDPSNIDLFVEYLENTGLINKVELNVKSVEVPKNEKNTISISTNMKGSFNDIAKVIALLENSSYNINIKSVYLNQELLPNAPTGDMLKNTKGLIPENKSSWQASVTFDVLSI